VLNQESNNFGVISILVTDFVLLFTMLIGLLRLRLQAGGALNLGRFLWNQVRWWQLSGFDTLKLTNVRKGLLWLLLATIGEVPSTVRLAILSQSFGSLISMSHYRRS
jgi:hypothetical protein